nr:hypothetical protein [Marinitoga lauensis]
MNSYLLLFLSIFLGILIGKIKIGNFRLGNSGALFSGLFLGWYATSHILNESAVISRMNTDFKQFFLFSLILFISSVGLIASKDLKYIIKNMDLNF